MNTPASVVYNNIINRRSIRNFLDESIDNTELKIILEAGNAAPSAGNLQSRELMLITNKEDIAFIINYVYSKKVRNHCTTFKNAAAIVLLLANIQRCREKYKNGYLYSIQDATLAGQNILLMASALGLGGCWVGQIRKSKILEKFQITTNFKLVGMIALGKIGT